MVNTYLYTTYIYLCKYIEYVHIFTLNCINTNEYTQERIQLLSVFLVSHSHMNTLTCPHFCPVACPPYVRFRTCAILCSHTRHTHTHAHAHIHIQSAAFMLVAGDIRPFAHLFLCEYVGSVQCTYVNANGLSLSLGVCVRACMRARVLCYCCCRFTGLLVHLTCLIIIVIGVYFAFI